MNKHASGITDGERYLSFSLGEEEFAIPLLAVKEVIAIPEMTPVPHTPSYFMGIMNLRGQVISVIDLRKKLSITPKQTGEEAIIICDLSSFCLGIKVDSVNSVLTPKSTDILPKPPMESKVNTTYILAVYHRGDHLVLFLDIANALNSRDFMVLKETMQKAS